MALTPEEEEELARLEAEETAASQAEWTAEDEAELIALESQQPKITGDDEISAVELAISQGTRAEGLSLAEQHELDLLEQQERESAYSKAMGAISDGLKEGFIDGPARNFGKASRDASDRISEAMDGNLLSKGLGTLDLLFSPISVPIDALAGVPAEDIAKRNFGASDEGAKMVRDSVNLALDIFSTSGEIKMVNDIFRSANPAIEAGKQSAKALPTIARSNAEKVAIQALEEVPEVSRVQRVNQILDPNSEIGKIVGAKARALDSEVTKSVLTPEVNKGMIDAVAAAANGQFDESKRVMEEVAGHLFQGNFDPEKIPGVLEKNGIKPQDLMMLMKDTASTSGKILQQYSTLAKQLKHQYRNDPKTLALLDAIKPVEQQQTLAGKALKLMFNATNAWRGMLVTQPATAARNFATQMGRVSVASLDEGLQPLFKGDNLKTAMSDSMNSLNHVTALYSRTGKAGREQLDKIFSTARGSVAEGKLLGQTVHEVAGVDKVLKTANFFNRTQEHFTRKVAFEASLRSQIQQAGKKYSTIDPKEIPVEMYDNAVEHALRMSMAADAKSKEANMLIRAWAGNPLTASIMPFPRFAFGNLLPFMIEHSPLGYLNAMSPETIAKVAKGDSKEFAEQASRATAGTLGLAAALNLRSNPELAGEEWYQIKTGENDNQREDLRSFAPFSLYMLEAEMILAPHKVDLAEILGGFVGVSRPAGNALILGDLLRQKSGEDAAKTAVRSLGSFISGYTTFFRGFKDLNTLRDPDQAMARDMRSDDMFQNLINPTVNNFPFIDKYLPESYTLLRDTPIRYEAPRDIPGTGIDVVPEGSTFLRQVTGRTSKTPTELEKKVVEVQLKPSYYYAKTGVADADREVHKLGGPLAKAGFQMLKKQGWFDDSMHQNWIDDGLSEETIRFVQAKVIGDMLADVKSAATEALKTTRPDLYQRILQKRMGQGLDGQLMESMIKDRAAQQPQPAAAPVAPQQPVNPFGPTLNAQ